MSLMASITPYSKKWCRIILYLLFEGYFYITLGGKKIPLSITTLILLTLNVGAANPKYIVQVSTDNARIQKITLNNAVNLQKHYGGEGKLDIEIDF